MDGGLSDDADGDRVDEVSGACARTPNEPGGGSCAVEQDQCGRVPVPDRGGDLPAWLRREDPS